MVECDSKDVMKSWNASFDIGCKADQIKSLARGVYALVIEGKENDDQFMAANTLLALIETFSDEISEMTCLLDVTSETEVAHG